MAEVGIVSTTISQRQHVPYSAVQAWFITSRQTVPDTSSMFGWKIRFINPATENKFTSDEEMKQTTAGSFITRIWTDLPGIPSNFISECLMQSPELPRRKLHLWFTTGDQVNSGKCNGKGTNMRASAPFLYLFTKSSYDIMQSFLGGFSTHFYPVVDNICRCNKIWELSRQPRALVAFLLLSPDVPSGVGSSGVVNTEHRLHFRGVLRTDGRRFEWILVRQINAHLPHSSLVRCWKYTKTSQLKVQLSDKTPKGTPFVFAWFGRRAAFWPESRVHSEHPRRLWTNAQSRWEMRKRGFRVINVWLRTFLNPAICAWVTQPHTKTLIRCSPTEENRPSVWSSVQGLQHWAKSPCSWFDSI